MSSIKVAPESVPMLQQSVVKESFNREQAWLKALESARKAEILPQQRENGGNQRAYEARTGNSSGARVDAGAFVPDSEHAGYRSNQMSNKTFPDSTQPLRFVDRPVLNAPRVISVTSGAPYSMPGQPADFSGVLRPETSPVNLQRIVARHFNQKNVKVISSDDGLALYLRDYRGSAEELRRDAERIRRFLKQQGVDLKEIFINGKLSTDEIDAADKTEAVND